MNTSRYGRVIFARIVLGVTVGFAPLAPASAEPEIECPGGYEPFDLEFRGGTVADYVRAIRAVNPCATVLVTPEAEASPVPEVVLRAVNVEMALRLIAEGEPQSVGEHQEFLVVRVFNLPDLEQQAFRIERLQRKLARNQQNAATDALSRDISVWGLSSIVALGMSSDRAIGAVEIALAMVGDGAEVRFHEPTALLIVRGTREQISVVHQIVGTLGDQAQRLADQKRAIEETIGSLRIQILEEEAKKKVALVRKQVSELAIDRIEAGSLDLELHNRHQVEIARAEADIAVSESRIEHYTRLLADAEHRLAALGG